MSKRCSDRGGTTVHEAVFGEIYPESGGTDEKVNSDPGLVDGSCCTCAAGDCRPAAEPIKIKCYTMRNDSRMTVRVINWGATIVSIKCPDKYGDPADVVLGFDDMKNYLDPTLNNFMGCVLGRCANRIKGGTFKLKNEDHTLTKNEGEHHLHGGTFGFGRQVWDSYVEDNSTVVMSYLSEDGEEGYPGAVIATVRFELTHDNRLIVNMKATTSKPTIVNLSHGSLFNLAGHDAGEEELKAHKISLNCDRWTFAEYSDPIPTGAIRGVGGTVMDLRVPRLLGDVVEHIPPGDGFDHNFCVVKNSKPELNFVCRALHAKSGRYLEVYSNQPGVQLYTGGRLPPYELPSEKLGPTISMFTVIVPRGFDYMPLPENPPKLAEKNGEEEVVVTNLCGNICDCVTPDYSNPSLPRTVEFLPGKCGAKYTKFGAFSVQPQNYPNAVNTEHFPCSLLRPGEVYNHELVYKFGIQLGGYM